LRNVSGARAVPVSFGGLITMKRLLVAVVLGAGLLLVTDTADTLAQGKKPAKAGTIELLKSKDGKYRFNVRDAEGKYLGRSAGRRSGTRRRRRRRKRSRS